jgi:exonuclease III
MIKMTVHSQNLRGSLTSSLEWIVSLLNDPISECTAILLQDIGITGPEGPSILRHCLGEHKLITHFSPTNKSRTVALIIHKSWEIRSIHKDKFGSLVGATISRGEFSTLLVSAYLPASIENYGVPVLWHSSDNRQCSRVQEETHAVYSTLLDWIKLCPNWIVGGDLNETRQSIDRKRSNKESKIPSKQKFIELFLRESNGLDVWRETFPSRPGFTYRNESKKSLSRIDYFLLSSKLSTSTEMKMEIGNWNQQKDHCRISLSFTLPFAVPNERGKPLSIPQPELRHLSAEQKQKCKLQVEDLLHHVYEDLKLKVHDSKIFPISLTSSPS